MHKTRIRVSDAIPEMPVSFEKTVERTLKSVCTEQRKPARSTEASPSERWTPRRSTRKRKERLTAVFAYSTAAIVLAAVLLIGGAIMKNAFFPNRSEQMSGVVSESPEQPAEPIAQEVDGYSVTIRLLPELEDAEAYAAARERALQPAFSEEDWGWIRKIDVSMHDFTVGGDTIRWLTTFRIRPEDKPTQWDENPFDIIDGSGMDLFEDSTVLLWNGAELAISVNAECSFGVDTTDGAWLVSYYCSAQVPYAQYSGTATVTEQFRLIDNKVDTQAAIATVGMIEQRFTFDTSGLSPTKMPEEPNALPHAFLYNGVMYVLDETVDAYAGEIDESAILGSIRSEIISSEWPEEDGQVNFSAYGAPYAMTEDGLMIRIDFEWRLFVPIETSSAFAFPSESPEAQTTPDPAVNAAAELIPSVRYNGTVYRLTDETFEGETILMLATIDGIEKNHVPLQDNHANFGETGMALALTEKGLVIYDSGSCRCLEPMLVQRDGPAVSGRMLPAIRYQGILYLLADCEDARDFATDEYITYSIASSVPPSEWPTEEEQINFDWLGARVAETKGGLIVEKDGEEPLLFRPTYDIPAVFRVKTSYVVPFWNFLSNPEGDGKPIAWVLEHDENGDVYPQIPFVEYHGETIDVTPRGATLQRIYLLNAQNEQIKELSADKLELMESCYQIPDDFLETLAPGVYTLSAVTTQRDGDAVTNYECVIRIQVGE